MNHKTHQGARLKSWLVHSPGAVAAVVALSFLLFSAAYLVISTLAAAESFHSVSAFSQFELVKGMAFMLVTAVLIGLIVLSLLNMVRASERSLAAHRQSLLQAERRALTSLFAATVAHDANNLLCVARGQVELTVGSQKLGAPEVERLNRVMRMLNDLVEINRRLIDSGRRTQNSSQQSFDLTQHICRAIDFVGYNTSVRQCHLETELQDDLVVVGDPLLLEQAVINLVLNAAEASPPKTRILVRTAAGDHQAIVEVHDGGPGIPQHDREKIFEPFFTGKPDGAGIGLVTVRSFAEAHRAHLTLGNSPLGGACFRIAIPTPPKD